MSFQKKRGCLNIYGVRIYRVNTVLPNSFNLLISSFARFFNLTDSLLEIYSDISCTSLGVNFTFCMQLTGEVTSVVVETRTVRKSDYTPALALPKHMAGIFDEKCRVKEKYRERVGKMCNPHPR